MSNQTNVSETSKRSLLPYGEITLTLPGSGSSNSRRGEPLITIYLFSRSSLIIHGSLNLGVELPSLRIQITLEQGHRLNESMTALRLAHILESIWANLQMGETFQVMDHTRVTDDFGEHITVIDYLFQSLSLFRLTVLEHDKLLETRCNQLIDIEPIIWESSLFLPVASMILQGRALKSSMVYGAALDDLPQRATIHSTRRN